MCNANLADRDWNKIFNFLQGQTGIYPESEEVCWKFVETMFRILRTGSPVEIVSTG